MKKNDVFTFTAPNGVEVQAVVLNKITHFAETTENYSATYLCYSQNRLFTWIHSERTLPVCIDQDEYGDDRFEYQDITEDMYGETIVDYAILPDYDAMLENYQHQIDMANDYADKTL